MDPASPDLGQKLLKIRQPLAEWFQNSARQFPWSQTLDPYRVWISEIMLQQTVVTAALDHYQRWMTRWPRLPDLAGASEDEVVRCWEGLGYYSRARNLLKTAQILISRGLDQLPLDYHQLRKLPGIGDYTASAILSFCQDAPLWTLDGNLKRVFQRFFFWEDWTPDREKSLRALAEEILSEGFSLRINQGLMQLGQLVCRPSVADCGFCPLAAECEGLKRGTPLAVPEKKTLTVTKKKSWVPVCYNPQGEFLLVRGSAGVLKGLWTFPRLTEDPWGAGLPGGPVLKDRIHSYTRFKEHLAPRLLAWSEAFNLAGEWVAWDQIKGLAMPSVYRKIWEEVMEIWEPPKSE